jgi:iron(III) transport system ATP-binding protein
VIDVECLSKEYVVESGSVAALHDVSLRVEHGKRLGLFGPSGSGKTTLLRCIAGLEVPVSGIIRIGGREVYNASSSLNVVPWKRPIGFVSQDYSLWPHLNVLDNVVYPLRHGRSNALSRSQQAERALGALRRVRLEGVASRFPSELSGGQRQRVALARALVYQPSVLLMDEPLSSLDAHLRRQTRGELMDLLEESGITTILVSHDHVDALFMTSAVGIMRCGRLVQTGTPLDVFMRPADAAVAQTLDIGSVFACRQDGESKFLLVGSGQTLDLPKRSLRNDSGPQSFLLIPGDACRLWRATVDAGNRQKLVGRVVKEGYTGRGWCVLAVIAGVSIEVWECARTGLQYGDSVEISVDVERVQLLNE